MESQPARFVREIIVIGRSFIISIFWAVPLSPSEGFFFCYALRRWEYGVFFFSFLYFSFYYFLYRQETRGVRFAAVLVLGKGERRAKPFGFVSHLTGDDTR